MEISQVFSVAKQKNKPKQEKKYTEKQNDKNKANFANFQNLKENYGRAMIGLNFKGKNDKSQNCFSILEENNVSIEVIEKLKKEANSDTLFFINSHIQEEKPDYNFIASIALKLVDDKNQPPLQENPLSFEVFNSLLEKETSKSKKKRFSDALPLIDNDNLELLKRISNERADEYGYYLMLLKSIKYTQDGKSSISRNETEQHEVIKFVNNMLNNEEFDLENIALVSGNINSINLDTAYKLLGNNIELWDIKQLLEGLNYSAAGNYSYGTSYSNDLKEKEDIKASCELIDKFLEEKIPLDEKSYEISIILRSVNRYNLDYGKDLINIFPNNYSRIIHYFFNTGAKNASNNEYTQRKDPNDIKAACKISKALLEKKDELNYSLSDISKIIQNTSEYSYDTAKKYCLNKEYKQYAPVILELSSKRQDGSLREDKEEIEQIAQLAKEAYIDKKSKYTGHLYTILQYTTKENFDLVNETLTENLPIPPIAIEYTNSANKDIVKQMYLDKDYTQKEISEIPYLIRHIGKHNLEEAKKYLQMNKDGNLPFNCISLLLNGENGITLNDIETLKNRLGKDYVDNLSTSKLYFMAKLSDLCLLNDINEIPISKRKKVLKQLISLNAQSFEADEETKKLFPLIPSNNTQYCELLPKLVASFNVKVNPLTSSQIEDLNNAINSLSTNLSNLSDNEFNSLKINQEYSTDDFIKDVENVLSNLDETEKRKVFDYFDFEIVKDNETKKSSLIGYPKNVVNEEKSDTIKNQKTKDIIEQLRLYIEKYNTSKINCSNKTLEEDLSILFNLLPELRTMINRTQHQTQDFDLLKHSLKVTQKIVQNEEFDNLSNQDKKIILLASLFHDIAKQEGKIDKIHQYNSAFDSYFILKKMNLSQEEENKIYSLIKNHEWLAKANTTPRGEERKKVLQDLSYDMQYNNLFKMNKIFSQADLKAVKKDDSFFNKHFSALEECSKVIEENILELQKTQPLLPVTKIPTSSRIKEAITQVNLDGSTNLKGIYQDKQGLIAIAYNEVDNDTWEKIGFKKGSISKGIKLTSNETRQFDTKEEFNTGNIKFFVHGLEENSQLANFDAFNLPDSQALLSVSYAERPESKYRFFRAQGVILNVDNQFVHGGGDSDSGSGCKKTIQTFKDNYIFGNKRESDRSFISNLIKEDLNMNDEEYIEFIKQNANKPMSEIKPKKVQEKLIKSLGTMNSKKRHGNRRYNEMYVSNPKVMATFTTYDDEKKYNKTIEFIDNQPTFIKDYSIKHDIPMFIFGD